MAVVIDREGRAPSPNPTNLPRVTVKSLPVLSPKHLHVGSITGRTSTVYTCDQPGRNLFWKENYDRRQSQLACGGFHTSPARKYQEVGEVELNDKTLILQALGQNQLQQELIEDTSKVINGVSSQAESNNMPKLRARTHSQIPDNILELNSELQRANSQLDQMRKGHGLFDMFNAEKLQKEKEVRKIKEKRIAAELKEWQPGIIITDDDTTETLQQIIETNCTTSDEEKRVEDTALFGYYKLRTLVWILECMKLESPYHMPSLHTFWSINKPVVNEAKGRRAYDRVTATLKQYEQITVITNVPQTIQYKEVTYKARPSSKLEQLKAEEIKLRKQKRLTAEQVEKLKQTIEEELNCISKKAKSSIIELAQAKHSNTLPKVIPTTSTVVTDPVSKAVTNFQAITENRDMIVHEQLSVMARERQQAMEQRFSSLKISRNMWEDLNQMRQGVKIETTTMACNKLMMNYNWLPELKSSLSEDILANQYCQELLVELENIQDYMKLVGPQKMSKRKLINVLSLLRPWELLSPTISSAVEFVVKNVIYIVPEDYQAWLQYHSKKFLKQKT